MEMETAPIRTLSGREAEVVGWLEAERRRTVTPAEARAALGWTDSVTWHVLSRLAQKGWLRRTAQGRYETVLAETGGWSVPNPWAALSTWKQPYYVGLKSAAYELNLTPDRPGSVQVCVPPGAKRPLAWSDMPIVLVVLKGFDQRGANVETLHGFSVRVASAEKVLIDGGVLLGRMGGGLGFARVVDRAAGMVDWTEVVRLAQQSARGDVSLRRIAAILELLERSIPEPLASAATAQPGASPVFLGERATHGTHGDRLRQWQVVVNIDRSSIREEVRR